MPRSSDRILHIGGEMELIAAFSLGLFSGVIISWHAAYTADKVRRLSNGDNPR